MIPKNSGDKAEKYINKFFKGVRNGKDCYDIETSNYLIEVKSCNAVNKANPKKVRPQFGRYSINPSNHVKLYLEAIKRNKIPIYIFVLTIKKQRIFIKKEWEDVVVPTTKNYFNIPWYLIFYDIYSSKYKY